jgi:hypothetical protein
MAAWIIGRVSASSNMQRVTGTIVITCIVAAAAVGAAFDLITWAANRGGDWVPDSMGVLLPAILY